MDAILDQSVCSIINSLKNELYYITYKDHYPTTTTTTTTIPRPQHTTTTTAT